MNKDQKRKIKILVISDEVWNDEIHGNNILTNWFNGFDGVFANIYCSPGKPFNDCCKKYFQITDMMMVKSFLKGEKAGKAIYYNNKGYEKYVFEGERENKKLYSKMKTFSTDFSKLIRELIWNFGKYDIYALREFINDFHPDIIFSPRMATIKLLRLENIIYNIAKVPIIAFTGDAEYSMRLFKLSPFFWIKKIILRKKFRKMMPFYSLYYTLSEEQLEEYKLEFGNKFKILRKCCNISSKDIYIKEVKTPIKMVYAGKLYNNRWKTLSKFVEAIKIINKNNIKMILNIYTKDKINNYQFKLLDDGKNSFIKGSVSPKELESIYKDADIALHVESFDLKNKLLTRISFSTKIIDCLNSGCAVIVAAWKEHSGYKYLKKEDAAITMGSIKEIKDKLFEIVDNPTIIEEYSKKARNCALRNHKKEKVQKEIYYDFIKIIDKHKKDIPDESNAN